MARKNTLLLDLDNWDLVVDSAGNIAVASPPYSLAQDVASACKLFKGEQWYRTEAGVPYFQEILGKMPPQSLVQAQLEKAAMTVPGVASARCIITAFENRGVSAQILFVDESGAANSVNI